MSINVKRRCLVRIISFSLALIIGLGGLAIKLKRDNNFLENHVNNEYSKSIDELSEGLRNIDVALEKSVYSSTATQFSILASELTTEAKTSKDALANLPVSTAELSTLNKFLSQVGNYTMFLSKKLISGGEIDSEERKVLMELRQTAKSISSSVDEVRAGYQNINGWVDEISNSLEEDENEGGLGYKLNEIEEALTDYPTLTYDGPFADNIYTATPKMLENEQEIDVEKAKQTAAEILAIDSNNLQLESEETGKIQSFVFVSENATVSVSKQGGYVVYMRKYRAIADKTIETESAIDIAREYLNQNGKNSFNETYYYTEDNLCVISFVHKEGNTLCYPDMVKVGVALDNGEIVFLESRSYLMNHYDRSIAVAKFSEGEARSVLSTELKIIDTHKVVIPTLGRGEAQCYEFYCVGSDNQELLVYINVATLQEENILLLLKSDGGILTK